MIDVKIENDNFKIITAKLKAMSEKFEEAFLDGKRIRDIDDDGSISELRQDLFNGLHNREINLKISSIIG